MRNQYKYELIAINEQGARVSFYGDTIQSVKKSFKTLYSSAGFVIYIVNHATGMSKAIKKTHR